MAERSDSSTSPEASPAGAVRRAFTERAAAALERGSLGVLLSDIDLLKHINAAFGIGAGDRVVAFVDGVFAEHFDEDATRWASDEWVAIVAVGGKHPDASRELEEVRDALEEALHSPYRWGPITVEVSATVGAHVAPAGSSFEAALAAADQDMYDRKLLRRAQRPPDST